MRKDYWILEFPGARHHDLDLWYAGLRGACCKGPLIYEPGTIYVDPLDFLDHPLDYYEIFSPPINALGIFGNKVYEVQFLEDQVMVRYEKYSPLFINLKTGKVGCEVTDGIKTTLVPGISPILLINLLYDASREFPEFMRKAAKDCS